MARLIISELPENADQSTLPSKETDNRARHCIAVLAKNYYGTDDKTLWTPNPINQIALSTNLPQAKTRLEYVCQTVLHKTLSVATLIVSSYVMGRPLTVDKHKDLAPRAGSLHVKNLQERGIEMYPPDEEFLRLHEETLDVINSLGVPARGNSVYHYQASAYSMSAKAQLQRKAVFDYRGTDWESDTRRLDQALTSLFRHVDSREKLVIFDAPLVMKRPQLTQQLSETRQASLGLNQTSGSTSIVSKTDSDGQTI